MAQKNVIQRENAYASKDLLVTSVMSVIQDMLVPIVNHVMKVSMRRNHFAKVKNRFSYTVQTHF